MAEHNEIGKIGENIAKTFLMKQNFLIIETNYRTKYGEIDIIAKKDNIIRFIEVKSVKVNDLSNINNLTVKPEENLTASKWSKICISIENYLSHKNLKNIDYQIDLACVYINTNKKEGKVKLLQNIIKE